MPPSARATLNRANFTRLAGPVVVSTIARYLITWINPFMTALRETRRRQAERVIRKHRHLIDNFND